MRMVISLALVLAFGAAAQTDRSSRIISTGHKPVTVVDGTQVVRACWYQGQQYSEGAPLEVGGQLLFCLPKNDFETNGSLIWRAMTEREQRQSKIQVTP
ncbi:DUF1496 domain-containing protein [Ferrimonas balearica]|uniref:DUF1496 domain-containing protein n=1 Tax=Ferrimonas balearica TaxID=44012 RepID=UPI001C99C9DB|nr:DUF1496 domain-containing protein [Ferrimonas balearica]MBY5993353.1 YnjH family protein [Ferrimonas balearica]